MTVALMCRVRSTRVTTWPKRPKPATMTGFCSSMESAGRGAVRVKRGARTLSYSIISSGVLSMDAATAALRTSSVDLGSSCPAAPNSTKANSPTCDSPSANSTASARPQ